MGTTRRSGGRWLGVGLASITFLAACAGPGTYNDSIGRPGPPGTELARIVPSNELVPASPTTLPATPRPRGQALAFCQDVAQLQALGTALVNPGGTAVALDRVKALVDRLPGDAPREIKPAATQLTAALNRIIAGFQSLNPNPSDLTEASMSFQSSLQQVIQYTGTHC